MPLTLATLSARLEALELTAAGYLRVVVFVDGGGLHVCEGEQLAYTMPGSRVVYVCGSRFEAGWRNHPEFATASLIHETLHTLGLGENPPSSSEITETVRRACFGSAYWRFGGSNQ